MTRLIKSIIITIIISTVITSCATTNAYSQYEKEERAYYESLPRLIDEVKDFTLVEDPELGLMKYHYEEDKLICYVTDEWTYTWKGYGRNIYKQTIGRWQFYNKKTDVLIYYNSSLLPLMYVKGRRVVNYVPLERKGLTLDMFTNIYGLIELSRGKYKDPSLFDLSKLYN